MWGLRALCLILVMRVCVGSPEPPPPPPVLYPSARGTGDSLGSRAVSEGALNLIQREESVAAKRPRQGGVVESVAKEVAAIASAVVKTIISPIFKTISNLLLPVLQEIAQVLVEKVFPVVSLMFDVWYNSPPMRLVRWVLRTSLEVLDLVLHSQAVRVFFTDILFPLIELVLDHVIFPPVEFVFRHVLNPIIKYLVWPVVVEVANVTWNVVIPTTQMVATIPLLVLDKTLNLTQAVAKQLGLPESAQSAIKYFVFLGIGKGESYPKKT